MQNEEVIEDFLEFGEDRVYFLMALARPKENKELTDNSKPCLRYVVKDENDLQRKLDRLKHEVERFDYNFRVYLSVNARNTVDAFFNLRRRMDNWVDSVFVGDKDQDSMKNLKRIDKKWKSELQRESSKDETFFIFDVDEPEDSARQKMEDEIVKAGGNCLISRETPNGWHIVTKPFQYPEVSTPQIKKGGRPVDYEVLTDGMIFLEMINQ